MLLFYSDRGTRQSGSNPDFIFSFVKKYIMLKQGRDQGQDRVWEGFFKLQS